MEKDYVDMGYIDQDNPVNVDKVLCEINSLFDIIDNR